MPLVSHFVFVVAALATTALAAAQSGSFIQFDQSPRYDPRKDHGAAFDIYIDETNHFTVVRTTGNTEGEVVRSGYIGISGDMKISQIAIYNNADASDAPADTRSFALGKQLAAGHCSDQETRFFSYLARDVLWAGWTGPVVYGVILPTAPPSSAVAECTNEIAKRLGGPTAVVGVTGAIPHALGLPWRQMNGFPPHALVLTQNGSAIMVSFNGSPMPGEHQVANAALPPVQEVDHIILVDVSEDVIPAALRDSGPSPPVHKLSHADVARGGALAAVLKHHRDVDELFMVYHTYVRLSIPVALSIGDFEVAYKILGEDDKAGSLRVRLNSTKLIGAPSTLLKLTIGDRPRVSDNVLRTTIHLPSAWDDFLVTAIAVWTSDGVVLTVQAIDSASSHRVWQDIRFDPDYAELKDEKRRLAIIKFHQAVDMWHGLAWEHRATDEALRMRLVDEARAAGVRVEIPQPTP